VRLVSEGSDVDFRMKGDGRTQVGQAGQRQRYSAVGAESKSDSDVRIVGQGDEDSAVGNQPPKKGTDSDIRLEEVAGKSSSGRSHTDDSLLTEEIDLDEEIRAGRSGSKKHKDKTKARAPNRRRQASPFELSDSDLESGPSAKVKAPDSSSDLELTPGGDSSSPIALSSDEMPAVADDQVDLAGAGKRGKGDAASTWPRPPTAASRSKRAAKGARKLSSS